VCNDLAEAMKALDGKKRPGESHEGVGRKKQSFVLHEMQHTVYFYHSLDFLGSLASPVDTIVQRQSERKRRAFCQPLSF